MNVLFLGGSGQIGFPTAARFAERFPMHQIWASSRSGQAPAPTPINLTFIAFDPFEDDWSLLPQVDLVYNCVGQIKASKAMSFERIHLGMSQLLIRHRAGLGNPRIVQLSALGAGEHPKVPFLATKAAADEWVLSRENTYVVRPSIVCTENTMLLRKLKQLGRISKWFGGRLILPAGFLQAKVQPIMIEDLADLLIAVGLAPKGERIMPAVGPGALRFAELLSLVHDKSFPAWEIPRKLLEPLIKYLVSPLLPSLINYDQFRLLFEDNVGDKAFGEALLQRTMADTKSFWTR
ncbi:MAG: hypothetical protein AAFN10_00665 [Bacteroidota bacterium]